MKSVLTVLKHIFNNMWDVFMCVLFTPPVIYCGAYREWMLQHLVYGWQSA